MSYYIAHKSEYDKLILFKFNYWNKNQIYTRYLDLFERIGGVIYNVQKSDRDIIRCLQNDCTNFSKIDILSVNYPRVAFKLKATLGGLVINKLIVIPDGFGYYGNVISKLASYRREKGLVKSIIMSVPILLLSCIRYFISNSICFEEYTLLRAKDCSLNELYLKDVKELLVLMGASPTITRPTLIFADQPLIQLGILSDDEYAKMLNIIQQYALNSGMDFLVKKHPITENIPSEYTQLYFDGLLEEFCLVNDNIKVVVSHSSTGLFNLQYMSCAKVMKIGCSDIYLSKNQKKIFDSIQTFSNN